MSKCKNLYKSDTAKNFRDEVSKIKGSIENKLKHLTHSTSKVHSDSYTSSEKSKSTTPEKQQRLKNQKHSVDVLEHDESEKKVRAKQKSESIGQRSSNRDSSTCITKPIPPKRPPPPRPLSPSKQNLLKKTTTTSASAYNFRSNSRELFESPIVTAKSKRQQAYLSSRDSVPSRPPLPPRSAKNGKGIEAKRQNKEQYKVADEENLSDIYEFEEVKPNKKRGDNISKQQQYNKYSKNKKEVVISDSESVTSSSISLSSYTRSPKHRSKIHGK